MIVEKPWGKVTTYALNQTVVGADHHDRARPGDLRALPPAPRRDVDRARRGPPHPDREPPGRGPGGGGVRGVLRGAAPHLERGTKRGRVLEIAHGYTTEDDVFRLQDDYGRTLEPEW